MLVTAGPTVEDIDPVRFLSNRSSGRMGYRIAEAARDRGASVVLVSGPTSLEPPAGVEVVRVRSAEEMQKACAARASSATVVVAAAAVADFRPASPSATKIKKKDGRLSLELVRTPDILKGMGAAGRRGAVLVGFAAETDDVEANAASKLAAKNLDLIVANDVTRDGHGFDGETNGGLVLRRDGSRAEIPLGTKRAMADRILDEVLAVRRARGAAVARA